MKIIYRVDSRLVHGQTINYWCQKYNVSKIIIVNDELAKDELRKMFFKIAISNKIDLEFFSIKDSININYDIDNVYMVIFADIDDVIKYLENNGEIDELIVSNTSYGEDPLEVYPGIYVNKKAKEKLDLVKDKYNINLVYKIIPD